MALQSSQEKSLTTKYNALKAWNQSNIVVDSFGEGNKAASIQTNMIAPQLSFNHRPTSVDECHSVALELLLNKTFPTK
jgi:hypothetical protein